MSEKIQLLTPVEDINKLDLGEDTKYLILFIIESSHSETESKRQEWKLITGRQKAYNYIKDCLTHEFDDGDDVINIRHSRVLVDNPESDKKISFDQALSIYKFMDLMIEKRKVVDGSSFDIRDYMDYEEDEVI